MRTLPLLALLLACKDDDTEIDTGTPTCDPAGFALSDANNYAYTGALDLPVLETASGVDIALDWSAVVEDIQCHDLEPGVDVDNLGLLRLPNLTQDEVEVALATDSLLQSDISGYVSRLVEDGTTTASLSEFSFFGTAIDVPSEYTADGGTYVLLLTTGTTPGQGARMLTFLAPTAESAVTSVAVPNGCGVLDFSVELEALARPAVCADGAFAVDWSGLTVDGQGGELDDSGIDGLMLGYYEGASVADLEASFLDLETTATWRWDLELTGGTSADLALATDATGAAFGGFYGDGAWVLALRCSRCTSPAPPFFTVLEPVGGAR